MLYHYAVNGIQFDPVEEGVLRDKILQGAIGSNALCWREGWSEWRRAADAFPELFGGAQQSVSAGGESGGFRGGEAPQTSRSDAEKTRREYLTHEASVKSIGSLYLLGSFLLLGMSVAGFLGHSESDTPRQEKVILSSLFLILAVVQFSVGRGLRKLKPGARLGGTILAAIGLIGFPIGTIINIYVLYLLRSDKGAVVFSEAYREVIEATSHIKYKTPAWVWIILAMLVLGLLSMIAFSAME